MAFCAPTIDCHLPACTWTSTGDGRSLAQSPVFLVNTLGNLCRSLQLNVNPPATSVIPDLRINPCVDFDSSLQLSQFVLTCSNGGASLVTFSIS
jgi:hypothetical protein